ncbi:MAG: hypothetical protein KAU28_00045, partial [Phycisphaerae bacterium]|nr:hypothetical protein [Phycisphaerae bacterium]
MQRRVLLASISFSLLMIWGCRKPVHFPAESAADAASLLRAAGAYDADHDGKLDFFTYANAAGRINTIAYDNNRDEKPDVLVNLDAIPVSRCRHLVIILDGFGYDLIKQYREAGGLRLFHAPSRVVAPYPTLTDVAMEDIFGHVPCAGFEVRYFDRKANRIVGGSGEYLAGANQPYNALLQ